MDLFKPPTPEEVQAYNRVCNIQGEWFRVLDVKGPTLVRSLAAAPGILYARDQRPIGQEIGNGEYQKGSPGFIFLPRAGTWWIYSVAPGSSAVNECWILHIVPPELAALIAQVAGSIQAVNVKQVGGTEQTGADLGALVAANGAGYTTVLETVLRLRTAASLWAFNGAWSEKLRAVDVNGAHELGVVQGRESGWLASLDGRRYYAGLPIGTDSIVAQAAYVATTPTIHFSGTNIAQKTNIRSIRVQHKSTPVNPSVVLVTMDTANRYVAATGTLCAVNRPNSEWTPGAPANLAVRYNPTIVAATLERLIVRDEIPAGRSQYVNLQFADAVRLHAAASGDIAIWVYDSAGLVAPSVDFMIDLEAV